MQSLYLIDFLFVVFKNKFFVKLCFLFCCWKISVWFFVKLLNYKNDCHQFYFEETEGFRVYLKTQNKMLKSVDHAFEKNYLQTLQNLSAKISKKV